MEIKNISVKPYEKSIFPGISFNIEIGYIEYQETIIDMDGWLETDDQKIIAEIKEEVSETQKHGEIWAYGSSLDYKFKEQIYSTTIVALLDRKALSHIEKRRLNDRKGDVNLTLNLKVKSINSRATISHIHMIKPAKIGLTPVEAYTTSKATTDWDLLIYACDSKFSSSIGNKWILSGDRGPVFLRIAEQTLKKDIRIPSTDWIHDYTPQLGLGEYFVIEIPKGKKTIEKAWEYIEKAEECFRTWDTKGVYAHCRETGKLLEEIVRDKFENKPTIKKWKRAIEKFNHLTSLDLHTEEIKKEKPEGEVKVGKADTEHILIVTKALIKYAEELLEEE